MAHDENALSAHRHLLRQALSDGAERDDLNTFEQAKAEARRQYQNVDLKRLVMEQAKFRDAKEELERQLAQVNAFYDVLRFEMVPGRMDEMGVNSIKYEGIGRVSLTADVLVSTKPGAKEGLFSWLKRHGLASLIQPTINSSTLKSFVKGRMRDAKPCPEEYLNITPVTRASITKVPTTNGG